MPKKNIFDIETFKKEVIPSDFIQFANSLISESWNFKSKTRTSFKENINKLKSNDYKVHDLNDT